LLCDAGYTRYHITCKIFYVSFQSAAFGPRKNGSEYQASYIITPFTIFIYFVYLHANYNEIFLYNMYVAIINNALNQYITNY